jgi:hypothetical protein
MKTGISSKNIKKYFLTALIILISIFVLYVVVHYYANSKIMGQFASGYEKNKLGDYCKNSESMIFAVYDAPLFQGYTNLSVYDETSQISVLVWVPLYYGDYRYGTIVPDPADGTMWQIEFNDNLNALHDDQQTMLAENNEAFMRIITAIEEEWNIELDPKRDKG